MVLVPDILPSVSGYSWIPGSYLIVLEDGINEEFDMIKFGVVH